MQVQNKSYQFPFYESAILKKQKQSRHLSPKVTHVYPERQTVQKILIKRHHLDDTQMKEVLYYDYQEGPHPKQYVLKGKKHQYVKKNTQKFQNQCLSCKNKPIKSCVNSQYFDKQPINNGYQRPERDNQTKLSNSRKNTDRKLLIPENQTRLKKSTSTMDFLPLQQMENKVLSKLLKIQSQNERISQYLIQNKVNFPLNSSENQRYKSENRKYSAEQSFSCFKNLQERQQSKDNQKLKNELMKIKQQTKKFKKQEVQRSQSFRLNKGRMNKRVQCQIHDSKFEFIRKFQSKPSFFFDSSSDTDSQFSDF